MGVWTDNWRAVKNAMLMGSSAAGMSTMKNEDGNAVTSDSATDALSFSSPLGYYRTTYNYIQSLNDAGAYIKVGTGSAVPAATDYRLDTYVSSIKQLSIANAVDAYDTATGKKTKTVTLTLQNQSNSPVTLTEWGVFVSPMRIPSPYDYLVCVYHDTFATPITLASYEAATLELTLEMTLSDPL